MSAKVDSPLWTNSQVEVKVIQWKVSRSTRVLRAEVKHVRGCWWDTLSFCNVTTCTETVKSCSQHALSDTIIKHNDAWAVSCTWAPFWILAWGCLFFFFKVSLGNLHDEKSCWPGFLTAPVSALSPENIFIHYKWTTTTTNVWEKCNVRSFVLSAKSGWEIAFQANSGDHI